MAFRFLCLLVLASGMGNNSWCQKFPDIASAKSRILLLDSAKYGKSDKIPFKKIEVLDFRFDTSKVGYVLRWMMKPEKLVVKRGVQYAFTNYLNSYYKNNLDSGSSRILLIVLKKLWLQSGATNKMLRSKDLDHNEKWEYTMHNSLCIADVEVFAGSGETYQALTKVNYVFSLPEPAKNSNLYLLRSPFDSLVHKIITMDVETTLSQKKNFSLATLHSNYKQRFEIPVLTNNSLPRGIYLSFQEFKNAKAVYSDFKFKTSRYSADVTIRQNEKDIILTDYWAFFDGKNLYIKPGLVPFKVIRQGNTFDMFGSLRAETYAYSTTTGTQIGVFNTNHIHTGIPPYPLQVDMETGKVY